MADQTVPIMQHRKAGKDLVPQCGGKRSGPLLCDMSQPSILVQIRQKTVFGYPPKEFDQDDASSAVRVCDGGIEQFRSHGEFIKHEQPPFTQTVRDSLLQKNRPARRPGAGLLHPIPDGAPSMKFLSAVQTAHTRPLE